MNSNSTLPHSPPFTSTPQASPPFRPRSVQASSGPKQLGDFYTPGYPQLSVKRAIVVFYNPDDAQRARQANDRYYFPPTASTPGVTLPVFRGARAVLVPVQLSGPPPD